MQIEIPDCGRVRVQCRRDDFLMVPLPEDRRGLYRWTRHAFVKLENGEAVLDAPYAAARLSGPRGVIAHIFATAEPLELLAAAGLMTDSCEEPFWEFHDALFHSQSSRLDPLRQYGATYRFQSRLPPPAPVKPPGQQPAFGLARPPLPPLAASLATILDRRRSSGTHGARPLGRGDLSAFFLLATRRLPTAGALNELAFYLVAGACEEIAPGIYRYDLESHTMAAVAKEANPAFAQPILHRAAQSWGTGAGIPQAVILIAARVPRQAYKYEGIAYRNSLLDSGIALESMYLAATALGLAACALGWNDPAMLAAATGIAISEETAMAAFVLGTSPEK